MKSLQMEEHGLHDGAGSQPMAGNVKAQKHSINRHTTSIHKRREKSNFYFNVKYLLNFTCLKSPICSFQKIQILNLQSQPIVVSYDA